MTEKNQITSQPNHGKILHSWTFPEFTHYRRSPRWFLIAGLVALAAFLWAVFQNNVLFGIILILSAIIYVALGQRRPRQIPFILSEDGITVDRDFTLWSDLEQFWIVYQPPEIKKLFFRYKGLLRPNLTVLLEKQNPVTIRKTLLEYLREDINGEEPATDQLSRVFKL